MLVTITCSILSIVEEWRSVWRLRPPSSWRLWLHELRLVGMSWRVDLIQQEAFTQLTTCIDFNL